MRDSSNRLTDMHSKGVVSVSPEPRFFASFSQKVHFVGFTISFKNQGFPPCQHPFTFTGKERDPETGYTYFGARYYDSDLSGLFLSVDPMADKYPSISPYAYCAWNPIKLVDPDGNTIVVTGNEECVSEAIRQMQQKTTNLKFHLNKDGSVSYSGKAKTKSEKYMASIIDNNEIVVNLTAQSNSYNKGKTFDFGAFDGNTLSEDGNQIEAYQIINVIKSKDTDRKCGNKGNAVWHEIAEAYEGGLLSKKHRISVPASGSDPTEHFFSHAHKSAGKYFPGNVGSIITNIDYPKGLETSIMLSRLLKNNPLSKSYLEFPQSKISYFYHR